MTDDKKKVELFRQRREARLRKRGLVQDERSDSVDEFRERRNRRLFERKFGKSRKSIDKARDVWYNTIGGRTRGDADDTVNGQEVDWVTLKNKSKVAIGKGAGSKGKIVAGPNALKGRSMTEVKEHAKANAEKRSKQENNPGGQPSPEEVARKEAIEKAHKQRSQKTANAFLKNRGFEKGTDTFVDSIKQAMDHGMSQKQINDVLNNLKPEDIYEINGEHGVIGLASKIDNKLKGKSEECQAIWDKAKNNGVPITNDVLEITKSLGASMSGLEFAVKAGLSTAEKIDREHADWAESHDGQKDPRTDEEALSGLNDIVRYTQFSDHDKIAQNALSTMKALEDKGYTIKTCKNRYNLPNQDYYDIKIVATNPDGQDFELQFHSKESLDVKNVNHGLYEEQRKVETPEERKKELSKIMAENAARIPKPKDYEKVPQIKNGKIVGYKGSEK